MSELQKDGGMLFTKEEWSRLKEIVRRMPGSAKHLGASLGCGGYAEVRNADELIFNITQSAGFASEVCKDRFVGKSSYRGVMENLNKVKSLLEKLEKFDFTQPEPTVEESFQSFFSWRREEDMYKINEG